MNLRKALKFNAILGLTLPKAYTTALGIDRGDYLEVFLRDSKTIVVKRHNTKPQILTIAD